MDIDQSNFPAEVVRREYVRIKVFRPEHIEQITRISGREISGSTARNRKFKVKARLTQPDGTQKQFGDDALRVRSVSERGERNILDRLLGVGRESVKERFLAIAGVEAGSILEYQMETRENYGNYLAIMQPTLLQHPRVPVRQLDLTMKLPPTAEWAYNCFLINQSVGSAELKGDEAKKMLTVTGKNIPALADEPLSGPTPMYHALALVVCYEKTNMRFIAWKNQRSQRIDVRKTGPWSVIAGREHAIISDRAQPTKRIRDLAAQLTQGVTDPQEKARRIHAHVQMLHETWVKEAKHNKTDLELSTFIQSLDELLDYNRKSKVAGIGRQEFLALAIVMYEAAGLEARAVIIPDRRRIPFHRGFVSRAFMPNQGIAVKIGDQWKCSAPLARPALPFGSLPWYCEGEIALWVKEGQEEFLPVKASESGHSLTGNGGSFTLGTDGSITGTGKRRFTGHSAYAIREKIHQKSEEEQKQYLVRQLSSDLQAETNQSNDESDAESQEDGSEGEDTGTGKALEGLVVTKISGLDNPHAALEIEYTLRLANYAVVAGDQIIVRPWVFRSKASNPFTGDKRRTRIYFPYAWQELDVVHLTLPEGYVPQLKNQPGPSSGTALYFNGTLQYDPARNQLRGRREFASNIMRAEPDMFVPIKTWYDDLLKFDTQEVVLTKQVKTASAPTL
jgi:hypothetical protein